MRWGIIHLAPPFVTTIHHTRFLHIKFFFLASVILTVQEISWIIYIIFFPASIFDGIHLTVIWWICVWTERKRGICTTQWFCNVSFFRVKFPKRLTPMVLHAFKYIIISMIYVKYRFMDVEGHIIIFVSSFIFGISFRLYFWCFPSVGSCSMCTHSHWYCYT